MQEKTQLTGTNWGTLEVNDQMIQLENKGIDLMKVPIKRIQNSIVNKNEIAIEFTTEDMQNDEDCLCEMRLFIPQQNADKDESEDDQKQTKKKENNEKSEDEEKESEEKEEKNESNKEENEGEEQEQEVQEQENITYLKGLNQEIINKAQIGKSSGDSIVTFPEIQLVVPRGKYTVDIYKKSLRFHGTSFNYNVEFKNILKAFLLPLADEAHVAFVIALDQAIKQGNTVYPYLVAQFTKGQEAEVELKLNDDEIKQINDKLSKKYSGDLHEIVATLLKFIVGVNIIIPGDFQSNLKQKCLKCTQKTNQGWLFPLSKSIIFIHKPVIFIHCSDITAVEFHRIGTSQQNKLFDMKILTKNGNTMFVGFDMKELQPLQKYFQDRKIKIRKMADDLGSKPFNDDEYQEDQQPKGKNKYFDNMDADDDDEEDDDFDANEYEEDDDDSADADEDENENSKEKTKKKQENKPKPEKMDQENVQAEKQEQSNKPEDLNKDQ